MEIEKCLQFNVKNKYITNIYLLNERIYTDEELSISSNKIIQIDIKKRLQFKDIFEYICENNIKGYNIIINSDIFFDRTIKNLFKSDIHINKKMYALLRYDYDNKGCETSPLFGDRGDSQDTWIVHSNFSIGKKECKVFNFEFGKPGCDNKLTYLMSVLGFEILNDPEFIKSYHIHTTNVRNYNSNDRVKPPYEIVMPKNSLSKSQIYYSGADINLLFNTRYNHKNSNVKLYEYITKKLASNEIFVIPRISTVETNYAVYVNILSSPAYKDEVPKLLEYLETHKSVMKNNAGIKLTSMESMEKYSKMYLQAFHNCEMYGQWAPFDAVYRSIQQSHQIINKLFESKETIYSEVFDVYHYIYSTPWTFALKDKRILIVSTFEDSIKTKIENRKEIYGIDLFPNCEIVTIKPPQTQGSEESQEFDIELKTFTDKLDAIRDTYDIALVSCGGYGSLVCSHIYNSGKSAIYVGGVLQMYWGILGARWFSDRPDIIRLFLNKSWTKPKESEKPKNHQTIEGSCYW